MTSPARTRVLALADLLQREHECLVDFLLSLAAFDRDRGWVDLGHASLWAFLHRELGLSATAAFQRKVAVELLQRFPAVEGPLRDGRLCMSSVVHLARVLAEGNEAEILPRFFRLSAREARELVAELQPRAHPPQREVVTAVASPPKGDAAFPTSEMDTAALALTDADAGEEPAGGPGPAAGAGPALPAGAPVALRPSSHGQVAPDAGAAPVGPGDGALDVAGGAPAGSTSDGVRPGPPDAVDPLDAELRRLHLTVSRAFLEKVQALRLARSHARPGATTAELLEEAVDFMLAREARRRSGADAEPRPHRPQAAPGYIPAHVRAYVYERDGGACQWPLEGNGVCGSKLRLEVDHVIPKARGGPSTPGNLRLLCGFHNAEWARRCFGEEWMARFSKRPDGPEGPEGGPGPPPPTT